MSHRHLWMGALVGILLLSPVPVRAGLCMPVVAEKNSAYDYIVNLADALSYTKQGQDRVPTPPDPKQTPFDLLVGLKQGKADLECARSRVAPFLTSSDEKITQGAGAVGDSLKTLIDLRDLNVMLLTKLLNNDAMKPGTATEILADIAVEQDKAWHQLILAVVASTYAVVEVEPTTGKMSRLALTRKQRDEIIGKLVSAFGPGVKVGLKAGQNLLMSAAAALYQVVGDPNRTLRPA